MYIVRIYLCTCTDIFMYIVRIYLCTFYEYIYVHCTKLFMYIVRIYIHVHCTNIFMYIARIYIYVHCTNIFMYKKSKVKNYLFMKYNKNIQSVSGENVKKNKKIEI